MANQFIQVGKNMVHVNDILKQKKKPNQEAEETPTHSTVYVGEAEGISITTEPAYVGVTEEISFTEDVSVEAEGDDANVDELRKQYFEKFQKEVPVPKKNNVEWIKSKLE